MRALIRLEGDDVHGDLGSLQDWLGREARLRGRIARERPVPRPGEMGSAAEVLVAALGTGGAVSVLAASLGTWLTTRRSRVTLKITGPGGRSVEVDGKSDDVLKLLHTVLPERREDDGDGTR
ncbi:effector-associated constant component EACC1 [Amycolatopsis samaneae]|uniref:Uncharacterized protein n=1 Tax=Amycolatopsis samaneae TaxID=664691 RepID=A0ABW5GSG7_9PSEU